MLPAKYLAPLIAVILQSGLFYRDLLWSPTSAVASPRPCTTTDDCGGSVRAVGAAGFAGACACTCAPRYGPGGTDPRNCSLTRCQLDTDCISNGAFAISPEFHPCQCYCKQQYGGSQCQMRICHVNYDCNGVGTAITGTYPDCRCTCPPRYGGRNCRTLSATRSRTTLASGSASFSLRATVSLSGSFMATLSQSFSTSRSSIPSASPSHTQTTNGHAPSLTANASSTLTSFLSTSISASPSLAPSVTEHKIPTVSARSAHSTRTVLHFSRSSAPVTITSSHAPHAPFDTVPVTPSPPIAPEEPAGNVPDDRRTIATIDDAPGAEAAQQSAGSLAIVSVLVANPVAMLQLDAVLSVMDMASCAEGSLLAHVRLSG